MYATLCIVLNMVLVYANHVSDKTVLSTNSCTQGSRNGVPSRHASTVHLPNTEPAKTKRKLMSEPSTTEGGPEGNICVAAKKRHEADFSRTGPPRPPFFYSGRNKGGEESE